MFESITKEEHFNITVEQKAYIKDVETAYVNLYKPMTKEEHYKWIAEAKAYIKE